MARIEAGTADSDERMSVKRGTLTTEVGDTLNNGHVSDATRTGVLAHLTRLAREMATTRGARGLVREVRGIGTHILHYPTGVVRTRVRPHSNGNGQVDHIHDT